MVDPPTERVGYTNITEWGPPCDPSFYWNNLVDSTVRHCECEDSADDPYDGELE